MSNITLNTKTYAPYRVLPDSVQFAGPAHDGAASLDYATLGRQFPKPTKDFRGVSRPLVKMASTQTLDDGKKAPLIFTLAVSNPVGTVPANVLLAFDDFTDLLVTQVVKDLITKLTLGQ